MASNLATAYKSGSQRARVVTEFWAENNLYCPNCSSPKLNRLVANSKASDFTCPKCGFWYQLKGQKSRFGNSITDGAYEAMMSAIRNDETPNFYFLQYDLATWSIRNLLLVPHFAFPPSAIIKRPPLSATARRAGWIGCNIALNRIPADARISIVTTLPRSRGRESAPTNSSPENSLCVSASSPAEASAKADTATNSSEFVQFVSTPQEVRAKFRKIKPLKEISIKQRGWTLDVLNIIQRLTETKRQRAGALQDASRDSNAPEPRASVPDCGSPLPLSESTPAFTNEEIYAYAPELEKLHPDNRHIKDKIRQQLQVLRDTGFLTHLAHGEWHLK